MGASYSRAVVIIWEAMPRYKATRKLGVFRKARQYFRLIGFVQGLGSVLYGLFYCSHLGAGAPQYQLDPFIRIQRTAGKIVEDSMVCKRFDTLDFDIEMSFRCAFFYHIYHGE